VKHQLKCPLWAISRFEKPYKCWSICVCVSVRHCGCRRLKHESVSVTSSEIHGGNDLLKKKSI
jgi:hypothetical protein